MIEKQKTSFFKTFWGNLTRWDKIAIGVFVMLMAWYAYAVQTGMGITDEGFYDSITMRLKQGDRLFVDEWHISQLFSILQYIPYRIFYFFSGSNDGVILFMRIFTIVVNLPVYWLIYYKLREHELFAVIAAYLFCMCYPGGLMTLNYMVVPVFAMMVACVILFTAKEQLSLWKLIIVGLVVSCAVLEQPLIVLIYLLFSILCLVRAKKTNFLKSYDFLFNSKNWIGITIGCAIAFVIVVGGIILRSGLSDIIKTVPEMLTDSEYDLSIFGGHTQRFFFKLFDAAKLYGVVFTIAAVLVSLIAFIFRNKLQKKEGLKPVLLIAAFVLFAAQVVHAIIMVHVYRVNPMAYGYDAPGYAVFLLYGAYFSFASTIFGLNCYLLCENKNPRIFAFWITGTLMSLIETYSAEVSMSLGGPISNVTTLICLQQLWREGIFMQLPVEKKRRKTSFVVKREKRQLIFGKTICVTLVIALSAFVVWGSANMYPEGIRPYVEALANTFPDKAMSQRFSTGPYKGIRTSAPIKQVYDDILADMDEIKADSGEKAFYAAGICPFYYDYLELPVGTYSTWYVDRDSETRQLRYWELHPEKRPQYYYIPLYDDGLCFSKTWEEEKARMDEKLEFIQSISECTVKKGRAGYMVRINKWK